DSAADRAAAVQACPRIAAPSLPSRHGGQRPARGSSLRQPRLAQPVKTVLEVLGVLMDPKAFVSFNCETRVDPQHLRGFGSRLLKPPQLRVGARQKKMGRLKIGRARRVLAAQAHRLSIALEQVIRQTHLTKRRGPRKGIEADACLQYLDRPCGLARIDKG